MPKFYITTAIPYVNADPHIGFAMELIQADVLARYYRLAGDDTWFLTGSDENALKNVQAAEKSGVSVKEFAVSEKGVYRVEVYPSQLPKPISEQPWIISNPIYVR